MKSIAIVFGKGLDGCGVQRGGVEMLHWCLDNSIEADIFALSERSFVRGKGHNLRKEPIMFSGSDIPDIRKKLEKYDVVLINSYPSHAHSPATTLSFYENLVKKLEKPIVVGMMHEIRKQNIDPIPLVLQTLNYCDVVFNFSEKTDFAREFSALFPSKTLGERTKRFSLWLDVNNLARTRKPFSEREKRLVYTGRWTSMKDPRRILDLKSFRDSAKSDIQLAIHGIERSIGAKGDIIDHPNCEYFSSFTGSYDCASADKVPVFGPYEYQTGIEIMNNNMFVSSFFRLPKDPENYGDRMEYTQIEIIANGAVPVFDKHYGENNFDRSGKRYIDTDYLAIWSDRANLQGTINQLEFVANNPRVAKKIIDTGYEFIMSEFDSNLILPEMFAHIMKVGKDKGKFKNDSDLLTHMYNNTDVYAEYQKLVNDNRVPGTNFAQLRENQLSVFEKKARIPVKEFSAQTTFSLF